MEKIFFTRVIFIELQILKDNHKKNKFNRKKIIRKNKKQIKIVKIKKHNKIKENKKIKKNNKIKKMKENKRKIRVKIIIKINNKQSNFMMLINKQKLYNIIMIILNKNNLLKKMKTIKMIKNNSKMLFLM